MIILGITFIVLLAIGLPVAFTVGLSALSFFVTEQVPVQIVVQKMVSSTQSFSLLAVPFFVLAGNLMNETGITSRLIKFCNLVTGHMRGGLAQVSVLLSCLMGGISGSATADAAMESRILGEERLFQRVHRGHPGYGRPDHIHDPAVPGPDLIWGHRRGVDRTFIPGGHDPRHPDDGGPDGGGGGDLEKAGLQAGA